MDTNITATAASLCWSSRMLGTQARVLEAMSSPLSALFCLARDTELALCNDASWIITFLLSFHHPGLYTLSSDNTIWTTSWIFHVTLITSPLSFSQYTLHSFLLFHTSTCSFSETLRCSSRLLLLPR